MNYVDYGEPSFTPQGWQCPICKRVYSPSTPMCFSCGNTDVATTTTATATPYGKTEKDYLSTALDKLNEMKTTFCESGATKSDGGTSI